MEGYKQEIIRIVNAINNGYLMGNCPYEVKKVDIAIQWAWDNWEEKIISTYYEGDKPKFPPLNFIENWVENEDFEADGFNMDVLKEL